MVQQPHYHPRVSADERPNVLILMSDQHRHDLMTCAGRDKVATPNLDRVAANGVRFTNAYCPSPLCLPSRMSFLTGEYPHTLGLNLNYDFLDYRHRTLAHHFTEAGYLTALIGKMHFGDACKHGFEHDLSINDWLNYLGPKVKHYAEEIAGNPLNEKFFNTAADGGSGFPDVDGLWDGNNFWVGNVARKDLAHVVSELAADDTLDMFVARETVKFMRRFQQEPFMLIAGFMRPHPPMYPPRPWDELYPVNSVTLPGVGPIDTYPPHIQQTIAKYQAIGDERLRADRSGYYGNLAFLDHCVGHVLDGLDELGLRDSTIVVYCSDHGDMDGEHGMIHKAVMFDPSAKVPMIVSYPKQLPVGAVSDALVSLMDLYPTLTDLTGIGAPTGIAARSFAASARDPRAAARDAVFAELSPLSDGGRFMVRTVDHKLIHHRAGGDMLFNMENDPGECENLLAHGDSSVAASLRERLRAELGV